MGIRPKDAAPFFTAGEWMHVWGAGDKRGEREMTQPTCQEEEAMAETAFSPTLGVGNFLAPDGLEAANHSTPVVDGES